MSHVLFCYTCMPTPLVAQAASAGAPSGSQALSIHGERPLAQLLQIKCALFGPTVRLTSVAGHPRQCPTCGYHKARLTAQLAHTRVGVPRLQPSLRCRAECRREKSSIEGSAHRGWMPNAPCTAASALCPPLPPASIANPRQGGRHLNSDRKAGGCLPYKPQHPLRAPLAGRQLPAQPQDCAQHSWTSPGALRSHACACKRRQRAYVAEQYTSAACVHAASRNK